MHIDDWLDKPCFQDSPEAYAKFVLFYFRYPAWAKIAFKPWMQQYKLFCTYVDSNRYRVVGASRMGDLLLSKDKNQEESYTLRVNVEHCYDWSNSYD